MEGSSIGPCFLFHRSASCICAAFNESRKHSSDHAADKGVPTYDNALDTFEYFDGEELVPVGSGFYRTENETAFRRFRFVDGHWEVTEKNGTFLEFGTSSGSRIEKNPGQVFKWFLTSSTDTNGNVIEYHYIQFPAESKQIYIQQIRYAISGDDNHTVFFEYQDRPDEFGDFSSTMDIRTTKRCTAIRVFTQSSLVRRYALNYDDTSLFPPGEDDLELNFSLLRRVQQYGDDDTSFLPPLRFAYYYFQTAGQQAQAISPAPGRSISLADTDLLDVDGDTLPDVLHTDLILHHYYRNLGNNAFQSTPSDFDWSPVVSIADDNVQLMDVDADGLTDLLNGGTFDTYPVVLTDPDGEAVVSTIIGAIALGYKIYSWYTTVETVNDARKAFQEEGIGSREAWTKTGEVAANIIVGKIAGKVAKGAFKLAGKTKLAGKIAKTSKNIERIAKVEKKAGRPVVSSRTMMDTRSLRFKSEALLAKDKLKMTTIEKVEKSIASPTQFHSGSAAQQQVRESLTPNSGDSQSSADAQRDE